MTLEETIAHHRWCADNCEGEVRNEHFQTAVWLDELVQLKNENERLRKLLSSALIVAGFSGRQYLDEYLRDEEGTTLWQELKGLRIEVDE